ncbi:MAG: thioredoxin family protein [Candidatus Aenigmatarchaeota archaeon]
MKLTLMNIVKKDKWIAVFILLFFLASSTAHAPFFQAIEKTSQVEVILFYSKTCPHCAKEELFLNELEKLYSNVSFVRYSIEDPNNLKLMKEFCQIHNIERYFGTVPITFVKEVNETKGDYFIGFDSSEGIGKDIEKSIKDHLAGIKEEKRIVIPIFGDITDYSLPMISVLLGFFDGFNVCSIGALMLILGMVLGIKSRKLVLIVGGTYILTTSIVYGLLMFFWYKLFSIISNYLRYIEILIGAIGIVGGIYFLNQFIKFRKYGPACEMKTGKGLLYKFSTKFQKLTETRFSVVVLAMSILGFAAIITAVEFPCSAVIPVFYTGILATENLKSIEYILLMALYLFFYMLDEIAIFLIAFFTLKIKLASSKYITWVTLATSILLFIFGIYYLI